MAILNQSFGRASRTFLILAAMAVLPAADCIAYFLSKRGLIPSPAIYVIVFGGIGLGSLILGQLFVAESGLLRLLHSESLLSASRGSLGFTSLAITLGHASEIFWHACANGTYGRMSELTSPHLAIEGTAQ